jgi:hypothetical protein
MMIFLMVLVLWFAATGALIILSGWRGIFAAWQEPVLRRPVVIFESDDWGAGITGQAGALRDITEILLCFSDCDARRPVMTLGMVLAIADGERTLSSGSYQRQMISRQADAPLLDAITKGAEEGVFSVQLHGMEHFWPAALLAASKQDDAVKAWLARSPEVQTENLPSPLQSRWVDASVLPARRLSMVDIDQAVQEEVHAFEAVFGKRPVVVVPPTFVWNEDVENAWARKGVRVIVTPGCRYETRDSEGLPAGKGRAVYSGQTGDNGIVYLVRDAYFEPSFGHTASQGLSALYAKTSQGRPTLFEIHRFNFLGTKEERSSALNELEKLLRISLAKYPDLAFLSSEKLATVLNNRDPDWLELRFRRRVHLWISRLGVLPRLRKLAWLTGWIVPAGLLWKLTD